MELHTYISELSLSNSHFQSNAFLFLIFLFIAPYNSKRDAFCPVFR